MAEICKNCEYEIALNFCSNCGQKKMKRIDQTYLKDEFQYTFLHMNKGFFYSIKQLVKNPGKTAREFVEGNRVNHYKPILLVFFLSGIVAFLTNTLIHPEEIYKIYNAQQMANVPENAEIVKSMNDSMSSAIGFMMKYYSLLTLLVVVPFMSLCTWIAYRKWGYNFYENIVINSYYYSLLMVLTIVTVLPSQYLLKGNHDMFMTVPTIISMFGSALTYFWFYVGLYNKKSAGDVIVRSLIMIVVLFVAMIVLSVLGGVIWGMFFLKH
jgi:hypothetical protein